MLEPLGVLLIIFILWTHSILFNNKQKPKTVEEKFVESLSSYLKEGIKVRIDYKDK